jgi:hypothetical protein
MSRFEQALIVEAVEPGNRWVRVRVVGVWGGDKQLGLSGSTTVEVGVNGLAPGDRLVELFEREDGKTSPIGTWRVSRAPLPCSVRVSPGVKPDEDRARTDLLLAWLCPLCRMALPDEGEHRCGE